MNTTPNYCLETAREIVRLSELYIGGTVQLSLAADTRAMQLASALAPALIAIIAAGFTILIPTPAGMARLPRELGWMLLSSAPPLLYALVEFLMAARPRRFNVVGNYWREWDNEADLHGDLAIALIGQARVYQQQIDENNAILTANAARISRGLKALAVAPLTTAIIGLAFLLVSGPWDQ